MNSVEFLILSTLWYMVPFTYIFLAVLAVFGLYTIIREVIRDE